MSLLMKNLLALLLLFFRFCLCLGGDAPGSWTLDDFEDGDLSAAPGLCWIALADDLVGGASEAKLEIRPGGQAPSRHVLGISAHLSGRTPSFAGAWVPLDRAGGSVNLGAFEGVRLRVKGRGRIEVGFRAGMVNYMAGIDAGAEWRLVEIPFTSLAPQGKVPEGATWSPDAPAWFGITTPHATRGEERAAETVDFEVDDVALYGRGAGNPAPVASESAGSFSIMPFTPLASIPSTGWIDLGDDPARDGNMPALPDATRLEAIPSSADGTLWLRVTLRERPHERWMGVNVALDVDGDPANGQAWWVANSSFKFDRLVTVWCFRVARGCQGYIGIADADQVAAGAMAPGGARSVRFAIDHERRAFVVGVAREALRLEKPEFRVVAAVGSALSYADDVPGQGAATLR